jgi:hypothetical protein
LCLDAEARTRLIDSAVLTGTVDFSTIILSEVATSAILRAQSSQFLMFEAKPAPIPVIFVGVLTLIKMISAATMVSSMAVVKNKFLGSEKKKLVIQYQPGKKLKGGKGRGGNFLFLSRLTFRAQP